MAINSLKCEAGGFEEVLYGVAWHVKAKGGTGHGGIVGYVEDTTGENDVKGSFLNPLSFFLGL